MVQVLVILGLLISVVSSEVTLPSEPTLPKTICSTLDAALTQTGGLLPTSADDTPDTKRIQDALNACKDGEAVQLKENAEKNAFLSGPLNLPSGITLWIDKNVTLFASRNPRDYDKEPGNKTCGVIAPHEGGCNALITATDTKKSAVVGDGIIDGRGGAMLTGENGTWWDLGIEAKNNGGDQNNPRLIQINKGSDFTLYKITLHNAPKFHVVPSGVNGFIAWGVTIHTPTAAYPKYDPTTAKNTDAIDPTDSSNVVIAYSSINTGDDNVAIKSGLEKVSNIVVAHNHFYRGHGMSIGSQTVKGVTNVTVFNLTLDGTDNGLRIKSDPSCGGQVSEIIFEQVCIRNVDHPLVFDAHYSNKTGSLYPDFQGIKLSGVHILSSTKHQLVFRGYDTKFPLKITLDNVVSDVKLNKTTASHADITEGPGQVLNLAIKTGSNVKITGTSGTSTPIDCSKAFVPFPN